MVIRTEQALPRGSENLRFLSGEPRRTAAGEPLAVEYDTGREYFASALLLRLRSRLAAEEEILSREGRSPGDAALEQELAALRRAAAAADGPGLLAAAAQARMDLFPGTVTGESAAALRREIRALERTGAGERILTAPAAGWFSPHTDGWEHLSFEAGCPAADALSAVFSAPEGPSPGAGKLVTGSAWALAAFISAADAAALSPGTELELALFDGIYPARAASLSTGADGRIAVMFVCSQGLEAAADLRVTEARAVLARREGLQLPEAALRRDARGDYVLRMAADSPCRESIAVLDRRDGLALVRSDGLRPGSRVLLSGAIPDRDGPAR